MRRFWKYALPLLIISAPATANPLPPIKTVFLVLMENYGWSWIEGSTNAPYINNILLPLASYCEQYYGVAYYNPSNLGLASLPTYLWLEAGTNYDIWDNRDPDVGHLNVTNHLVTLLNHAGISWKTYQEDIPGRVVPLGGWSQYVTRHNPFVYFDDITGTNDLYYAYGIAHIRPYAELDGDLTNNTVAQYNFITPDLCHDMHGSTVCPTNTIFLGDSWLAGELPKIMASAAFTNNGALFVTWDDAGVLGVPIGMIVLSPLAKGGGYRSNVHYTHSSTLRTMQEIFGVTPWLGDAANADNLGDLFVPGFGFGGIGRLPNGSVELTAIGVVPGSTNLIQASSNLMDWVSINTNSVVTNSFSYSDNTAPNFNTRFYRLVRLP